MANALQALRVRLDAERRAQFVPFGIASECLWPAAAMYHANYFNFFEMGRTELLRAQGGNYREMEQNGQFMVVVRLECRFRAPARYDDLLKLHTTLVNSTPAKLIHEYRVFRDELLVAEANSTLACVDETGKLQRIPDDFLT